MRINPGDVTGLTTLILAALSFLEMFDSEIFQIKRCIDPFQFFQSHYIKIYSTIKTSRQHNGLSWRLVEIRTTATPTTAKRQN